MAKIRLTENFSRDWNEPLNMSKLPLQESFRLVEAEGKQFPILEKWEVPVWRLGKKNLNGRTYRESLGKKIEKECKDLVTSNLADHPIEEGSVRDIYSVAKNPHIREGILYVDAYIVDEEFEKKLNKMVEAGYGLGVSSSIIGELDDNNNVIDESVELERYFDWVLSPSYEVYVTKESKTESLDENLTINNMETDKMSDKLKLLTEKTTRLNLERILEDASKKETISSKISALEEALSFTSEEFLPDLHEKISEMVTTLKTESLTLAEKALSMPKLEEDLTNKEKENASIQEKITSLNEQLLTLTEKYNVSLKLLDEAKEYAKKADYLLEVSYAEKGSRFTASEYEELVGLNESLANERDTLIEKVSSMKEKNKKLSEKVSILESKIGILQKKLKKQEASLADYAQEIEDGLMQEEEPEVYADEYDVPAEDSFNYSDYGSEIVPEDDELELDVYNNDEVQDYYESLILENPNYKVIKEDILKCKTIVEAQRTALRLNSLVESKKIVRKSIYQDSKINESAREPDAGKLKNKGWL